MPFLDDNKRTGKANAAASQTGSGGRTSKETQKLNQFMRGFVIRRSGCPAVKGLEAVFGVEVKEKGIVLALQKLHHATHEFLWSGRQRSATLSRRCVSLSEERNSYPTVR